MDSAGKGVLQKSGYCLYGSIILLMEFSLFCTSFMISLFLKTCLVMEISELGL